MIIRGKIVYVYDIEVFQNIFHCSVKNTETNNIYKFEKEATPTGDTTNENLSVDSASVLRLGYGPISAARLAQLVKSGEITQSVQNGKIVFSKNNSVVKNNLVR